MKEIIDIVHKSIYPFFDVCEDGKEEPLTDKDKLLLEVNKAICSNLKALEQEHYGEYISKQKVLYILKEKWNMFSDADDAMQESINTIEALPPVPPQTKQELYKDTISREAVINHICESKDCYKDECKGRLYKRCHDLQWVYELPSVDSSEKSDKSGYWYIDERPESDREVMCSNCEQPIFRYHKLNFDYRPKFCPNCGAKMVEDTGNEG